MPVTATAITRSPSAHDDDQARSGHWSRTMHMKEYGIYYMSKLATLDVVYRQPVGIVTKVGDE
jgi:hypothetical protein